MLKLLTPFRLLFFSFLVWLVCYLIIPAEYLVKGNRAFPIFIFIAYNIALILGFYSLRVTKQKRKAPNVSDYIAIKLSFYIGIIGFVLKIVQLIFIQKVFSINVYEARVDNQFTEFNSGLLGVVIALTFPFAVISFLAIFYNYKWSSLRMKIASALFAALYIIDAYLNGARLPIAVILAMTAIIFIIFQSQKGTFFKRVLKIRIYEFHLISIPRVFLKSKSLIIITIFLLAIGFFKNAMIDRLEYYNYRDVLSYWEIQHESVMDEDFKKRVNSLNISDKNEAVANYSLYHYFTHAPFEFQKLVNHVDQPLGIFYGRYQFDVYFKFLRLVKIPVESKLEMQKVLYHPGYYITFWGPFYLDFGLIGLILAYLLGIFIKYTFNLMLRGYLPAILMYSYMAIILLASFHVSLFGGKYIYIFNAIVFFWILNKILYQNRVKKNITT